MIDFGNLPRPGPSARPVDPLAIFRGLPKTADALNDLWGGQSDALRLWHEKRNQHDTLISLNTGAGKTVVGLLIAQSLVNEDIGKVVYVCPTIDLVHQTASEAKRLGLQFSLRVAGGFSNDGYQTGKCFCITTYQALLQPYTAFRTDLEPKAIIFDDAHVAESIIRNFFTLSLSKKDYPKAYEELAKLFRGSFEQYHYKQGFVDITSGAAPGSILVPFVESWKNAEQIAAIVTALKPRDDDKLKYVWGYLRDRLKYCAVIFSDGGIEITPPFLPSRAIRFLERPDLRRVYLSATLNYRSDFARAFGRLPTTISPESGAGEGERLVLPVAKSTEGYFEGVLADVAKKHRVLIAVPSYYSAKRWEKFGEPPEREKFTDELNAFRAGKKKAFILAGRYDGIDLPDDKCRVMVLDGLPSGAGLLERYQFTELGMMNAHASRLACRLTQLFGRINRGRRDYGVFFIADRRLETWLKNDRYLALMPKLLYEQVKLGFGVSEKADMKARAEILGLVQRVIDRDSSWTRYYTDVMSSHVLYDDAKTRADTLEEGLVKAALSECEFAGHFWEGEIAEARTALDKTVSEIAPIDVRLCGWHNYWIANCLWIEGDHGAAEVDFRRAQLRLGAQMLVPRTGKDSEPDEEVGGSFAQRMLVILNVISKQRFDRECKRLADGFALIAEEAATSDQVEEGVRLLGEVLGFTSTRPDNDTGLGPDVLWVYEDEKKCIAFECKTDKGESGTYNKQEVGQFHNHLQWVTDNYKDYESLGLLIVGPDLACGKQASPSDQMHLCAPHDLSALGSTIATALVDIRKALPKSRKMECEELRKRQNLTIDSIFEKLALRQLTPPEK